MLVQPSVLLLFLFPIINGQLGNIPDFETFIQKYNKQYATREQYNMRMRCFIQNMQNAAILNEQDTAIHGMTPLSDLCPSDLQSELHRLPQYCKNISVTAKHNLFPSGWDWRTHGAVTPIKQQGICGASWAFAATAAMESTWARKKNQLVSLSAEEIVQCATGPVAHGCVGGAPEAAYEFVIKNGGIDSEDDYYFTSGRGVLGKCNKTKLSRHVAKFSSCVTLPSNEEKMATYVRQHGVISIVLDPRPFFTYQSGIISKQCPERGTLQSSAIVGFGQQPKADGGMKYWIVRPSIGAVYGEKGYFRLQYGVDCLGLTYLPRAILI
eukprot:TRINITY_DN59295_c0_g1_i2.p1 TRINITY_DN59295_c0_g1~~TRINITY_DN59295_c0_g1_i2.p1  ORF type:complete len:340 (-),score=21.52 TRINITY_DN59295_c0_g1_i2:66-1037(-)